MDYDPLDTRPQSIEVSREIKREENERLKRLIHAYKTVFASPEGEIVFSDLIKVGHLMAPSYVPQDPYTTLYNEGKRCVLLHINNYVSLPIEHFLYKDVLNE